MTVHPLAEFGLDDDADERAVKRAYARRLKVTRPDEDAAAFQALNEAYQEALAYIRWRDTADEEFDEEDEDDEAPEEEAERQARLTPQLVEIDLGLAREPVVITDDQEAPPVQPVPMPLRPAGAPLVVEDEEDVPPVPPKRPSPWGQLQEEDEQPDEKEYVFSVVDFVGNMFGASSDPDTFQRWLRAQIAGWPLTARPSFAHAIISFILREDVDMHPRMFDMLVDELGLNDVTSRMVDPMEIASYRYRLQQIHEPETLPQEQPVVEEEEPPSVLTRLQRGLGALPLLGWLFRWPRSRWAERIGFGLIGVFVLAVLFGPLLQGKRDFRPENRWYRTYGVESDGPITANIAGADKAAIDLLAESEGAPVDERMVVVNRVIGMVSERTERPNERLLAYLLYNKGHYLQTRDVGRSEETYRDLQRRFWQREDHDIALFVAASYVNMGHRAYEAGQFQRGLAPYEQVLTIYGWIDEGKIGVQMFKARVGKAETLMQLERYDDARSTLDEIDRLLKDIKDPAYKEFGDDSRVLRNRIARLGK